MPLRLNSLRRLGGLGLSGKGSGLPPGPVVPPNALALGGETLTLGGEILALEST